ncbi:AraC family transcriptional regulator [Paenibacillus sp. 79R4]|uniref:AraC family transcriptional regulator n=1 Tax=Paenibacillus sp. 79R4 TaxID=2212847 RepID=UPI0015BBB59C|nr:AraC family transcriptional regulator [Paenibacillus sp. 79R4]NWL90316.1 AraC family transcriptional regulator [Paenibacillus sp. 79R4]
MKSLKELTPYVGDVMTYLYDGSSNERLRSCSVFAFHLFTDGPGKMEVDGLIYPIDKQTLVFLRPGQKHAFHISSDHPLSSYNIYFDLWDTTQPRSLNRSFAYAPERLHESLLSSVLPCSELDQLPSVFSLQSYPMLLDLFTTVVNTFSESRYYSNEAANSLLYAWILNWYSALHSYQLSDYRIIRLLSHLNKHPDQRGSVEAWALFCGLKRTYFHELFLRETGMTPRAYHHKLRMQRASQLLIESELSITSIAERLGYVSIHPFTRHFSAYYGTSPKRYRVKPEKHGQDFPHPLPALPDQPETQNRDGFS